MIVVCHIDYIKVIHESYNIVTRKGEMTKENL